MPLFVATIAALVILAFVILIGLDYYVRWDERELRRANLKTTFN